MGISLSLIHILDVYKRQELSYQILYHPTFVRGACTTAFLDENLPSLLDFSRRLSESEAAEA